jgi:hypothetical protein
MGDFALIDPW